MPRLLFITERARGSQDKVKLLSEDYIDIVMATIYKECVGKRSRWPSPQQYSREELDWVISHNLAKAFFTLGMAYTTGDWREFYQGVDNVRLLTHENRTLAEEDRILVLCTCVFFIYNNWLDVIGARDMSISRDSVSTYSNSRRAERGN